MFFRIHYAKNIIYTLAVLQIKETDQMIKLYNAPMSGHCHRVRLAASLMNIPYEAKPISDFEGERKGLEFLTINPFGEIPVIVDGDVTLRDSNAIIIYLAEKYGSDGAWLPSDVVARAHVHEWLSVAASHIYRGPNMARLVKLFSKPTDYDAAVAVSENLFKIMDSALNGKSWLVGENPTLADIACYSYVRVADDGGLDTSGYSNIQTWLANVEKLDGFEAMPRPG